MLHVLLTSSTLFQYIDQIKIDLNAFHLQVTYQLYSYKIDMVEICLTQAQQAIFL